MNVAKFVAVPVVTFIAMTIVAVTAIVICIVTITRVIYRHGDYHICRYTCNNYSS